MKLRRVMFAAPRSGSGKTTNTCAVLQILKDMGFHPVSYKCGPDYIDPMFHKTVLEIPSKNLDTFFTDEETTKALFLADRSEDDFAVLEGVMGIYDGLGGIREEGSSYHLAKATKTPIILVVDAKGMGRSVIAEIAGFLSYDTEHLIQGVILNRMSKSYCEMIRPVLEEELKIPVIACFPENKSLRLESRHLGLQMPGELPQIQSQLSLAAESLKSTLDLERLLSIADGAEELSIAKINEKELDIEKSNSQCPNSALRQIHDMQKPIIAVAKDEAFCFYYEDNLRMLEQFGAQIVFFSPLHDKTLPEHCSGLLLGGGYPELYAGELSANQEMRVQIKKAIEHGMPAVAECGGFMYLHSAIEDQEGNEYEMARVLPGTCRYAGKLVRFGYIEIEEKQNYFLPGESRIRGHEFHYYDSTDNGIDCTAIKPLTGKTYPCIISGETYWFGFPHLYYPSNPVFAEHFMEKAGQYKFVNSSQRNRDYT